MSKPESSSAALSIAGVALRILIIVNWVYGAAILALLVVFVVIPIGVAHQAFELSPS
jgi:hypothetical protein